MHMNLPKIFAFLTLDRTSPPKAKADGGKPVADALDFPQVQFYNPDGLHFPTKDWATPHGEGLVGNGGNITTGLDMVVYDHQASWQREKTDYVGPVNAFIGGIIRDRSRIRK